MCARTRADACRSEQVVRVPSEADEKCGDAVRRVPLQRLALLADSKGAS